MNIVHRLFAVAIVVALADSARAEEHGCPDHPEATYTLSGDLDAERSQLESLVEPAKARGAVCILAYYDGAGPAISKMLAFRRANWVMEQLTGAGVPAGIIARALHASDKANARLVQVILGQ